MMQPGSEVKLKVVRHGNQNDMTVKLNGMPTEEANAKTEEGGADQALEGVEVANLTPQTAQQLNLPPTTTGVVVTEVNPSSPMADSGLRKGDVIQEVNHQPVKNVSEFQNAIRKEGKEPLLLVNRGGVTLFITA